MLYWPLLLPLKPLLYVHCLKCSGIASKMEYWSIPTKPQNSILEQRKKNRLPLVKILHTKGFSEWLITETSYELIHVLYNSVRPWFTLFSPRIKYFKRVTNLAGNAVRMWGKRRDKKVRVIYQGCSHKPLFWRQCCCASWKVTRVGFWRLQAPWPRV